MIGLMVVASVVLAVPAQQGAIGTFHDLENPAVETRVEVASDGVPIRCSITYNRSNSAEAHELCTSLMQSSFDAARDASGAAIYGLYDGWYQKRENRWVRTAAPDWNPRELTLTVNRMPDGVPDFATVFLRVVANAEGKIDACEVASPQMNERTTAFFCEQARATEVLPVKDHDGIGRESAQSFRVRITTGEAVRKFIERFRH